MKKRLAIITTHPIQYNAPFFALLNKRLIIDSKVFYTWGKDALEEKFDHGFDKKIKWDIDLLQGYEHQFVENTASEKGTHHFFGVDNPDLIHQILLYKPDAILVYGWSLKSHLKLIRYFKGKLPVYFRGDSIIKQTDSIIRKWIKYLFIRWVYRYIDFAFYTGIRNKAYFIAYGLSQNQLIYAPHAVDNDYFETQLALNAVKSDSWRNNLSINPDDIVFLYAGKLDNNKNTAFLCEAFVSINYSTYHLVIAGDGIEKTNLQKRFGGNANIHFIPFQNQSSMPSLYGMADVFVLPSLNETWGLSINEAMVCGCAILLSSSIGALPDLLEIGSNGQFFKVNDKQDLIEKLKLFSNRDSVKKMGTNAKLKISMWNYDSFCIALEKQLSF